MNDILGLILKTIVVSEIQYQNTLNNQGTFIVLNCELANITNIFKKENIVYAENQLYLTCMAWFLCEGH